MYAAPYIAYCKIVYWFKWDVWRASQAAAGTLLSLCWGPWPWSCASAANPQHTLLRCFPGAALCRVAVLRAGFASPVPMVTRVCAAWGDGVSTAHMLLYQPPLPPVPAVTHLCRDYLHAWKHSLKFYPLISAPLAGQIFTADSCQCA